MKIKHIITIYAALTAISTNVDAQDAAMLQAYRRQVEAYSHDVKAATHALEVYKENAAAAKADFKPKITGNADAKYTGNPLELNIALPSTDGGRSYTFSGRNTKYGASLTMAQPIYTGGLLKASYGKAKAESENAAFEKKRITNNLIYQADQTYWNYVATREMVTVAQRHRDAAAALAEAVALRVSNGYTGRNDLLTAEVRLNDAEYQLQRALTDAENARLALNSLAGVGSSDMIPADTMLCPDTTIPSTGQSIYNRPEMAMASKQIDIKGYEARMADAAYKPNLSVGINGSYTSPGYDFRAAPDPNYSVYATLSVPIFEWGKKGNTRRMGKHATAVAEEQMRSTADRLQLEAETARCNYTKACEQVKLTASSLLKAEESRRLTTEKYYEGSVSVTDVINAQIYYLDACRNHIASKLDACMAKSSLEYVYGY